MLDHPDFCLISMVFPYGAEPWTVRATFRNRKNGKETTGLFTGKEDYFKVHAQHVRQIPMREYITCSYEPKPKRQAAERAPIIGKGKGKGKKKA